jgi:excisionase family DNA binding protein
MNMLKIAEVAEMLKISESKAYKMVKKGTMPHVNIDGCIRIPEQMLLDMIQNQLKGVR